MKILFFCFLFLSISVTAQDSYPVSFLLTDSETGEPIEDADLAIKEIGYQSRSSNNRGTIYFDLVPIGEIHYIITKDGYVGADGVFNVTSIPKDNTLRVSLSKIPNSSSNSILVSGEVFDSNGKEIPGAEIELRAGRVLKRSKADDSGNYFVEFNLDELKYGINEFQLEVSTDTDGCKKRERFPIPKNNYIFKEVILDCNVSNGSNNDSSGQDSKSSDILKFDDWEFKIDRVNKRGNSLTVHFIVKSYHRDKTIRVFGHGGPVGSPLYDDVGNVYYASGLKVGNTEITTYVDQYLVAGVPYKGKITYSNISSQASKISLIQFAYQIVNQGEYFSFGNTGLEFRDIRF